MTARRNLLRAVTPMLVIAAVLYVPPLKHAAVSTIDAIGRSVGHSVTHVTTTTTTTTTAP